MTISEPRLRSLLRQAEKVADSGKRAASENLYRQITVEAPDSKEGWLGLARVLTEKSPKIGAYEKVLSLEPDNQPALMELAVLRGERPPTISVSAPPKSDPDDPFDQSRDWLDSVTGKADKELEAVKDTPDEIIVESDPVHEHDHVDDLAEEEFHDLVCYRHPNRDTSLRCYTCSRPICSECAVKTPVGYRCPTCIREAEDVFFNAKASDYIVAPLVSLPLSLVAGYLVLQFSGGFFFILIMLFAGGAVGSLIGRVAKRAIGRRRGRYLPHIVAGTVVSGVALPILFLMLLGMNVSLGLLFMPGIYAFVATSSAFYQMK